MPGPFFVVQNDATVLLIFLSKPLPCILFFTIFDYTNHRNTHLKMEKVTLTKLYDTLAQRIGKQEAECLTNYVEIKVKDELNTKTEILATKVSVKEEIHGLRNELKKDIYGLRSEMKEDIHGLRNEMKEDIHALRNELKGEIHDLRNDMQSIRNEMKEHSLSQQKWMLSTFIIVVIMILGLYAKH
jgi:hypothetical protein